MKSTMKYSIALISLLTSLICLASEVNVKSDKMVKSKDGMETIYSGNVVLTIDAGSSVDITSLNLNPSDSGDVYEGNVKISQDSMVVSTSKAIVTRNNDSVQIKMDVATISKE